MKIYLVRHGESEGNKLNVVTGQLDFPLSDVGKNQANCVTKFFENIKVDKVYASDLCRAVDTVLGVAKTHNSEIVTTKSLREMDVGDWDGIPIDTLPEKFPKDFECWACDIDNAICTNGESVAEMKERVIKKIKEIAEENPNKNVVIGAHATPVRCILAYVKGLPIKATKSPANASVSKINYENGKFSIDYEDERAHLGELITLLPENI